MTEHNKFFTNVYENRVWGDNKEVGYNGSSGGGSDIDYNIHSYIPFLKKFILSNNIKSVVDLGCGDFKCGPLIYDSLDVLYKGFDAYEKVVKFNSDKNPAPRYEFTHLDFKTYKETLPSADLCILKDVLQHWFMEEIYDFMDYLTTSGKYKYILICNCSNQKVDNPSNEGRSTPLSCKYLPLKKYTPEMLITYQTKEVSLIKL